MLIFGPHFIIVQILLLTMAMLPFFCRIKFYNGNISIIRRNDYKVSVPVIGVLFCIFATFGGDWDHYREILMTLYYKPEVETHLEPIHIWIINVLSFGNYFWWRLMIWGGTYYFLWLSFERLNINNLVTWSALISVCAVEVSSGRVYLGISIMLYGFCCIIKPRYKLWSFLKGVLLMLLSFFFHKSMIIYICVGFIALLNYKKWIIAGGIIMLPVIINLFRHFVILYAFSESASKSSISYLEAEQYNNGPGMLLYNRAFHLLLLIGFYLSTRFIINKYKFRNNYIKNIWQIVFFSLAVFLVIFLSLTYIGIGSSSISGRVFMGVLFPTAILISLMIRENYRVKANVALIFSFYLIGAYRLVYAYYCYIIG